MAKRGRASPLSILYAGSLKLFEVSNVPPLVSKQMPLGWGGASFSASVLAECQRPKLYAFPSRLRKQPSRGFCPCIIQEAPELETANTGFPSQEDLCLKPQLFKISVSRVCNGEALTPCPGDTRQAFLIEEPARGHTAKNLSGFGLRPKFFICLSPLSFSRTQRHEANSKLLCWSLVLRIPEAPRTLCCLEVTA